MKKAKKNKKRYNTAKYPIRQSRFINILIYLLSKFALIGKKYSLYYESIKVTHIPYVPEEGEEEVELNKVTVSEDGKVVTIENPPTEVQPDNDETDDDTSSGTFFDFITGIYNKLIEFFRQIFALFGISI